MSVGIRVGSFNPNDGTDYIVRSVRHDQAPTLDLETLELSRSEGEKLLSTAYRPKQITIEGLIKGTSIADLEANIDEFKKQMTVRSQSLDMEYAGAIRRYGVTTTDIIVTRDFYHTNFAPFEVVFQVLDPPFGFQAASLGGESAVKDALSAENQTVQLYEATVSFEGTAPPRPSFLFNINHAGGLGEISLRSLPGGQRLVVATAFTANDTLEVDTTRLSVLRNQSAVRYSGVFPEFELGDNTVLVGFQPRAASTVTLVQEQTDASVTYGWLNGIGGYNRYAQSFIAPASDNYSQIDLLLSRIFTGFGDPDVNINGLTVRIETDSGGSPSGSLVHADGTYTVQTADIPPDSSGWVPVIFPNPIALTNGITYWIVVHRESETDYPIWDHRWHISNQNPLTTDVLKFAHSDAPDSWFAVGTGGSDACFRLEAEIESSNLDWVVDIHAQYRKRYL